MTALAESRVAANGRPSTTTRPVVELTTSAYGVVRSLEEAGGAGLVVQIERLAELTPVDRHLVISELETARLVEVERLDASDPRTRLPSSWLRGQPGIARRGRDSGEAHWFVRFTPHAGMVGVRVARGR